MKTYKKLIKVVIGVVVLGGFISCSSDHDTFGVSNVTNYPILKVLGGNPALVQMGSSFTDPGVEATENGKAIKYTSAYKGDYRGSNTLNLNLSDRYVATYKATNSDGFSATANRDIYVYKTGDMKTSIEGLYTSIVKRTPSQGSVSATSAMKYVLIWKNTDGTYGVSDAIGGYYEYGRGFGVTYASKGLNLNFSGGNKATVSSQPQGVGAFGGNIAISDVSVDAASKTIGITSAWDSGFNFVVTLKQVN